MTTVQEQIANTVRQMYEAVGNDDRRSLGRLLCPDFHAFENGRRMSGGAMLDLMSKFHAQGQRFRWSVTEEEVQPQGNLAVIAYVNRGSITQAPGAEPVPLAWLETAVLRKEDQSWRVAFLHSNRMERVQASAE